MQGRWWCLVALALSVGAGACGGDDAAGGAGSDAGTDGSAMGLDAGSEAPDVAGAEADGEGVAPLVLADLDLTGVWAQLDVRSALATVPLAGQVTRTTTSVFRASLVQQGDQLQVTLELCGLWSESGTDLVQTIFPDALVASIAPQAYTVALRQDDLGVAYEGPRHVDARGYRPTGEPDEALPEAPEDPRVYDQDGDGRPGITVRISGVVSGEVWLVQRLTTRALGRVTSPDRIEGLLEWQDEQRHLGTDNTLLKDPTPSRPDPEAANSYFRSVRVEAGDDCAAILARPDML